MSNGYVLVSFATSPPQSACRGASPEISAGDERGPIAQAINLRDIHLQATGRFFVVFRDGEEAPLPVNP